MLSTLLRMPRGRHSDGKEEAVEKQLLRGFIPFEVHRTDMTS